MLATLGQFFFRFGLAFVIISTFVSVALMISVGSIPEILVRTSAIASALSGDFLRSVGKIVTYTSLGLGFAGLVAWAKQFFGGSTSITQLFQPMVLMTYMTLFTIACDGCYTAVSMLIDIYANMLGMYGGVAVLAIKGSILGLVIVSVSYYVLVKGFGAPVE